MPSLLPLPISTAISAKMTTNDDISRHGFGWFHVNSMLYVKKASQK